MASRRQLLTALGALSLPLSIMTDLLAASNDRAALKPVRVRTITAGLELSPRGESKRIESTLDFLAAAKRAFVNAGYEVQTLRIATNPWLAGAAPRDRQQLLTRLRELDKIVTERGAILSVGPVLTEDRADDSLPEWSSELIATTESIHHSVVIASPERAVHASCGDGCSAGDDEADAHARLAGSRISGSPLPRTFRPARRSFRSAGIAGRSRSRSAWNPLPSSSTLSLA